MHRLYLDEVGHDDLTHVHDERYRYLSLSGVIMDQDYARDHATPAMNAFKADIFRHDPDVPLCLHRKDIMNRRGAFKVLRDDDLRARFDAGLINYFGATEFQLITAVIDKLEMMRQVHWENQHPYHYLMQIMVEKYAQWLERNNSTGDIMPERRKGPKDAALQAAFEEVRDEGTRFVSPECICERIPSESLKFRTKEDNITGLQICDLIAHGSHQDIRAREGHEVTIGPFSAQIIPILRTQKYDRSPWNGRISGYGTKYLP